MATLKENTELQGKVDEDEDDIDSLTEKNRQLVKQVCAISQLISLTLTLYPSLVVFSVSLVQNCRHFRLLRKSYVHLFSHF